VRRALEECTTVELAGRRGVLLVPLGSCEQHGPHLPLGSDTFVATALCNDVAALRDVDVAPALAFGASGEHEGFAGLLSLGTDVTAAALIELVRSARATWSGVVFVSGHGGNADALARAIGTARQEGDQVVAWLPTDADGDAHAGATETSVLLTIKGGLVRDVAVRDAPGEPGWREAVRAHGVRAVSPSGVIGSPSGATVARGTALRFRWCAEVVALIDRLNEGS
jgi:mycofactocin precursor peptide peptidase